MKSIFLSLIVCAAFLAAFPGCTTLPHYEATQNEQVTHVVICWLKHHGNAAERAKLIKASKSFETIPGVVNVAAGEVLASPRPVVDSSYDVAVVITFKDQKSLAAYGKSPQHQRAVKELLQPLASKYVIYDFVNR
jgi:hypothetical protein